MKTLDSPAHDTIESVETPRKTAAADQVWQTAGDRVLLYLRCLNLPAPQALELALGALDAAEHSLATGSGGSPVEQAIQALHGLLSEQSTGELGLMASLECLPSASPPLERRPMVPEQMAAAQWPSLLTNLLCFFK